MMMNLRNPCCEKCVFSLGARRNLLDCKINDMNANAKK